MRLRSMIVAAGLAASAFGPAAGAPNQQEQAPASANPPPQQQVDTQSAKVFEGTIVKVRGKYVLQQSSTGQPYLLDDQHKAKLFSGRKVKVTATIDAVSNTLHVVDIVTAQR